MFAICFCFSLADSYSFIYQKYEGYPSGSMVDFACDANGSPILAVSSLAVHSKVCPLFFFFFLLFFLGLYVVFLVVFFNYMRGWR